MNIYTFIQLGYSVEKALNIVNEYTFKQLKLWK